MGCTNCSEITLFRGEDGAAGTNGTNGTNGIDGAPGADGADGVYGGWSSEWLFDNGTGTGTSAGDFRFDNITLSSVTGIFINEINADATDLTAFLSAISSADGNFGLIRISKKSDANIFWMGVVTGASDLGSEHDITLTHTVSNGTFTNNDPCIVSFVRNGLNGTSGAQGNYGGWSSEWAYDGTDTIPGTLGTGDFRFNNGTLNLVSEIYVYDINSDATDMQAFLDAFNNSGNFGLIRLSKKTDPNIFWMGIITNETDAGNYHTLSVTYVTSNGPFTDNDPCIISFVSKGNTGNTGPAGPAGSDIGLASNITTSTAIVNSTVEASFQGTISGSLSRPADTFELGSVYKLQAFGDINVGTPVNLNIRFKAGGVEVAGTGALVMPTVTSKTWSLEILVTTRQIGTTGEISTTGEFKFLTNVAGTSESYKIQNIYSTFNTTVPQILDLTGEWSVADPSNTIDCATLVLTKIK